MYFYGERKGGFKIDWIEFKLLCKNLSKKLDKCKFNAVYGIPSGGCYVALELSNLLNIPIVDSPDKGIVVVDNIVDSGRTLSKYLEYNTAALLIKPHTSYFPSFYSKRVEGWVQFPWELQKVETIEENIVRILELIGENPNRPGLKETPNRVARMYKEVFKGYDPKQKPDLTSFENREDGVNYDEMVFDTGSFCSYCEHHMMLFSGRYWIGFIPRNRIIGLSKIARIVDYFSSKLQIQERLVTEIANELDSCLNPKGLGIILRASHSCKEVRGIKNKGELTTIDIRGIFRNLKVKQEFLTLVGLSREV